MTVLRHGLRVDNFLLISLAKADGPVVSEPGHLPQAVGHVAAVGIRAGKAHPVPLTERQIAGREEGNILCSVLLRRDQHRLPVSITQRDHGVLRTLDKSGHGSSPFSNAAPVTPCRYDSRAKSGECRGGAASRSAVKKQTLAGRFDGEN
ncbi:hypothetical protein Q9D00_004133 [Salmonella enterica]|nr:hypothetical protein [Salmonella enterica]